MTIVVLVHENGVREDIARCSFGDDAQRLFDAYKNEGQLHVQLVYENGFGESEIIDEWKQEKQP